MSARQWDKDTLERGWRSIGRLIVTAGLTEIGLADACIRFGDMEPPTKMGKLIGRTGVLIAARAMPADKEVWRETSRTMRRVTGLRNKLAHRIVSVATKSKFSAEPVVTYQDNFERGVDPEFITIAELDLETDRLMDASLALRALVTAILVRP